MSLFSFTCTNGVSGSKVSLSVTRMHEFPSDARRPRCKPTSVVATSRIVGMNFTGLCRRSLRLWWLEEFSLCLPTLLMLTVREEPNQAFGHPTLVLATPRASNTLPSDGSRINVCLLSHFRPTFNLRRQEVNISGSGSEWTYQNAESSII